MRLRGQGSRSASHVSCLVCPSRCAWLMSYSKPSDKCISLVKREEESHVEQERGCGVWQARNGASGTGGLSGTDTARCPASCNAHFASAFRTVFRTTFVLAASALLLATRCSINVVQACFRNSDVAAHSGRQRGNDEGEKADPVRLRSRDAEVGACDVMSHPVASNYMLPSLTIRFLASAVIYHSCPARCRRPSERNSVSDGIPEDVRKESGGSRRTRMTNIAGPGA